MLDDLHHLRDEARRAIDHGRFDQAEAALLAAANNTSVADEDYVTVLEPLADLLLRRGHVRGALTVRWYLAGRDAQAWAACLPLLPHVPPVDRGRTLAAMGRLPEAAREMESAGLLAAASIYREQGEDWKGARALWSRLAQAVLTGDRRADGKAPSAARLASADIDTYSAALVQCNLARCAQRCGDLQQAHDAVVLAVRLLEEAADHFEAVGLRERAFDCFQVLIQLGREHRTFEDAVEGFVNCIRILREDHLTVFALQFLDDAIALAKEAGELSAAATLALEASQYARANGHAPEAALYTGMQAELWRDAARQHVARGDSPDIAENALLAAVVAFGEVGQFARVGALYQELLALDLPEARRAHYARAAKRYDEVKDDVSAAPAKVARGRQDAGAPEVWHVDLLEWEQAGSAVECCGDVLLARSLPSQLKRKAMLARLTAFSVEAVPDSGTPEHLGAEVRLADQLAQMQLYVVLSPLERLWQSRHRAVRQAVLSALQRLFFKRTFTTLRAALTDPDPGLADHAASALEMLHFPEAFDPLSRVVRESSSPRARASAIAALAQIDTSEAAEFLLGVLAHGSPPDAAAAARALQDAGRDGRLKAFATLARQELATSSPALQAVLRQVLGHG